MENLKILIAIPAYRCEKQIRRVLGGLAQIKSRLAEVESVVVFDNQSPDSTVAQANVQVEMDKTAGWISIEKNPRNVGLGGTHKIAFDWARAGSFSHVIVFHGDDQGDIAEIPMIVEGLRRGYDAVLGSRFMSGSRRPGYSFKRVMGNRLLNSAYSCLTLTKIDDLGSGLNGFRVAVLDPKMYNAFSNQFTFNMDLLLNLVGCGARIHFVPITWREVDQVSNARTFQVGWQALRTLFYWRLGLSQKNGTQNG